MAEPVSSQQTKSRPKCLDVALWRLPTREELRQFFEQPHTQTEEERRTRRAVLAVRHYLSPVDVYCYLKARFGEPNGFQNFLRADHSDNWIHWDFNLKAGDEDVYISGKSREIDILISVEMRDVDWRDLIVAIKADYQRVANEKSAVLKSLEQWVLFSNKYVEIASVCADLHGDLVDNVGGYRIYKTPSDDRITPDEQKVELEKLFERSRIVHRSALQLSLLTPVLAESFINMLILTLCKPDIRDNKRQFEAFVRANIDTKLFDLSYKCEGFVRSIDHNEEVYKRFKRVMDKRNNTIHGNFDPEREQIELVYFEGTRPLFKIPGDHIGKYLEAQERQYEPEIVIEDYHATHNFLAYLVSCLETSVSAGFTRIIETRYPGYEIGRKKMGVVLPDRIAVGRMQGVKYDDDLTVWDE
jgi:hypothetical protein